MSRYGSCDEMHIVCDRYDVQSCKSGTRQKREIMNHVNVIKTIFLVEFTVLLTVTTTPTQTPHPQQSDLICDMRVSLHGYLLSDVGLICMLSGYEQ